MVIEQETFIDRMIASPTSLPNMELDSILASFSKIGYRNFEVFTSWCASHFDLDQDPDYYMEKGRRYGMSFPVLHLPLVKSDQPETYADALRGVRMAETIGAKVVVFKADSIATYIRTASPVLDAVEKAGITPAVQNHDNSPIMTLTDVQAVHEGIADSRMKALLEVGHFHAVDVGWPQACEYLGNRIVHVHLKDQIGKQGVPFGKGEIDIAALLRHLESSGYTGHYLIEMEVVDNKNTLHYFNEALRYMEENWPV